MKQTAVGRKPYTGLKKAIVIALDVGTTFSGASYALLNPQEIPKIYEVTSFPGQEHRAGNPKIPSVLWYDRHGDPVKAGAEAEEPSNINTAEEQGWIKVELFKLRLRPKSMKLDMNGMKLPHLPKSKSAVEVFGDFLKYLLRCTRSFIIETHASGQSVWAAVENDIEFVLTHPNGWEGAQQSKMRKAAIYGGLVPNTDEGKAKVRFVTEGEASLHACVLNGLTDDVIANPSQHGFVVADAGGGTLDISSYAIKGTSPLLIEEIAPPDCLFSGSVFVSRRARRFLEEKLKDSRYGAPAVLEHITKRFDETTKRLFRSRDEDQYLVFGSPMDKDPAFGIRNGKLKLTGNEVAEFFEPSIEAAVHSIRNQIVLSGGMVKSVWLVGGFASSPCLFTQLQERLEPDGIVVSRPDGQTSKAVANGAIGFYCDHHVGARIAKHMYGVEFLREFDPNDPEHNERQSRLFQLPSGPKLLPDAFDCILARNSRVKESTTFSRKYCTELTSLSTLSVFEIEVWCYRGPGEQPKWILRGQDDFSTLCFVRADLSPLTASANAMTGPGGKKYWTIVFSIEIHFGLTEFKARIKWNHDGKTKYGPASIVYDEGGNKELEDDRDSQDEISALPSRYVSRAPSMAASRTHSMSNTPHTLRSPVEEASAAGTLVGTPIGRVLSTSPSNGDRHPDGYAESSVSKKSRSPGSHSHHRSSSQQLSPNPSTVSHHTSRSERSQHSANSSQHPSQRSASPLEPPRDTSHRSPSPRELSHLSGSQPVSREPSQLGQQTFVPPTTAAPAQHLEVPKSGHHIPNHHSSTPTQSHVSQSQQSSVLSSVLSDATPSISRSHGRSKSIVTATQPPEPTGIKFPSVSTVGSTFETPVPRSTRDSRATSLTPSDSASNIYVNHFDGNGTGSVVSATPLASTLSKKGKKDKNKSPLSTISSAGSHTTTRPPPTEEPQPHEPVPPVPQISVPASPSVSTSLGGSRLTTGPNTPINTRSLRSTLASTLSYVTDRSEHPTPPQPPAMSRQNSDSVIAGGLGSALGGVLGGVWGNHKSANASPVTENPPPGPATGAFESTLETIPDVELPGGFGGEREWEAPVPLQEEVPEPVVAPPSPPKIEEPARSEVPTPKAELTGFPTPELAESIPQTPNEPEQSVLSVTDKKKAKKQRDKERRDREAQEKKDREEREQIEREEREAQEKKEREEKKRQEKADREARKQREREEREEQERLEQERIAREALEKAEREAKEAADREAERRAEREAKREAKRQSELEAKERSEREAREQTEREAREQAERDAKERAERAEQAEREARESREKAEREAKEQLEKAAREKMDKFSKRKAEREAAKQAVEDAKREAKEKADEAARIKAEKAERQKAEKEEKERADREAKKAEQEAREKADRERAEQEKERLRREEEKRLEREEEERIRIENEARVEAEREARERQEEEKKKAAASKIPSAWGSTVGKNGDRSRKTSGISQQERKNEWASTWDYGSAGMKDESSGLPPIITSSIPAFDGAGDFFAKADSPGVSGEEVELRTPQTKQGKNGINTPSQLSKSASPMETADLDTFEDMGFNIINNMSARVSISSENERYTDAEQGSSPPETVQPTLAPEVKLEAFPDSPFELLETPQDVKETVSAAPQPSPAPPLTHFNLRPKDPQPQISTTAPAPAKTEPEKPLSLWERKGPKTITSPPPASNLFGGGDASNSSESWGDTSGGNKTDTFAMPNLTATGDRRSIFTDTARDQKRENKRENLVEGFLDSNPARRRNDSAQSQMTTKAAPKPAAVPQKTSGWGSWGTSILGAVANVVADRSPSPDHLPPPPPKPKIEEPPRGFTPVQPPTSQPAGFGSLNKPSWGATGDKPAWGGAKTGPSSIAQKTPAAPSWGSKPVGGSTWGATTGPTFGSTLGKNLTVDTTKKPLDSSPNTAGPENIPESAVEMKYVPAPGMFTSSVSDKKEEVAEAQVDAWGSWGESGGDKGSKKDSKEASPTEEKASEQSTTENKIEEPAKTEEVATPAEDDEFDWANGGKPKKKKGQVASVSQTPSAPATPDLDNVDDPAPVGGGAKKKKKKGKK